VFLRYGFEKNAATRSHNIFMASAQNPPLSSMLQNYGNLIAAFKLLSNFFLK